MHLAVFAICVTNLMEYTQHTQYGLLILLQVPVCYDLTAQLQRNKNCISYVPLYKQTVPVYVETITLVRQSFVSLWFYVPTTKTLLPRMMLGLLP